MKTIIDTNKINRNKRAMAEIENILTEGAKSAYNSADITQHTNRKYVEQEAAALNLVLTKYAVERVLAIDYENGLGKYAYIDANGLLVAEITDEIS